MTVAEVDAVLTGEGGFFETEEVTVGGVDVTTLKNRAPHLRALLQNSANHGGDGGSRYYVFDDGREATFAENIGHAGSVAAALRDRYDIGHGDRVAVLAANSPEWIQTFWAVTSLGGIVVPQTPHRRCSPSRAHHQRSRHAGDCDRRRVR